MKYNFYVGNAVEVDVNRVIAENPEETALLLVSENALVLLKTDAFDIGYQDGFEVADGYVCPSWGNKNMHAEQMGNDVHFVSGWGEITLPEGWRCRVVSKSKIGAVKATINRMREYQRKLEVRVSSL